MTSALDAFKNRTDLEQFGSNGLLLFALELQFNVDDIATVAATALTDGDRDRKYTALGWVRTYQPPLYCMSVCDEPPYRRSKYSASAVSITSHGLMSNMNAS
ncbi:MAG: hypothetical protein ACRDRU_00200 [Pseudonocardiaceae bacterium]